MHSLPAETRPVQLTLSLRNLLIQSCYFQIAPEFPRDRLDFRGCARGWLFMLVVLATLTWNNSVIRHCVFSVRLFCKVLPYFVSCDKLDIAAVICASLAWKLLMAFLTTSGSPFPAAICTISRHSALCNIRCEGLNQRHRRLRSGTLIQNPLLKIT